MATTQKTLTWTFKGVELYNDIADIAYMEGYVMKDDADPAKHSTQDIMADGNKEIVMRSLDKAFAEACELMHAYTSVDITSELTDDNTLGDTFQDYKMEVKVPANFSTTTANKAVALVQDYLVGRALEDYLAIINPQAAAKYHEKCDKTADQLSTCMHKRTRPTRLAQFPA